MKDDTPEFLEEFVEKMRRCQALPTIAAPLCANLMHLYKDVGAELTLLTLLLCCRIAEGDVCLRVKDDARVRPELFASLLERFDADEAEDSAGSIELREFLEGRFGKELCDFSTEDLMPALATPAVNVIENDQDPGDAPLVYANERLYFRRYYRYERAIADFVKNRGAAGGVIAGDDDLSYARECLTALFGTSEVENRQRWAAALALLSGFTVISGGPGTGKTTTVSRMLLILLSCMLRRDPHKIPRVLLCAPTGKAAGRLGQSLESQLERDDLKHFAKGSDDNQFAPDGLNLTALIPKRAETVHRLIGVRPHCPQCRNGADAPLNCDILVVDEVSMVDLPLFAKLCAAVPKHAVLILLGDKDQLCSVEAGSVMADLCANLNASPKVAQTVAALAGCDASKTQVPGAMSDHVMLLTKSYRFDERSGIGSLARLVNNAGNASSGENLAEEIAGIFQKFKDVSSHPFDEKSKLAVMKSLCDSAMNTDGGYGPFFEYLKNSKWQMNEETAAHAFKLLDEYRILCSNRSGIFGTQRLNDILQQRARLFYGAGREEWFPGRVVMVTRNNPAASLHNGDVGFCALDHQKRSRIYFPDETQGARAVNPVYLTDYEDGFAMTVHKSQGSEYETVALCVSLHDNAVLTRELIYTGITRAKGHLEMYADPAVLTSACLRSVQRESGLALRLGS